MTAIRKTDHFAEMVERNRQRGQETREYVEMIVQESDQPITTNEVRVLLHSLSGRLLDAVYIRRVLDSLVSTGRIASRIESAEERRVRAGGMQPRGSLGRLYMRKGMMTARTKETLVPGISLRSNANYTGAHVGRYKSKSGRKTSNKKNSGLVRKPRAQTGVISEMIEVLVSERTRELQARIDELEKMLTGIKKIVL